MNSLTNEYDDVREEIEIIRDNVLERMDLKIRRFFPKYSRFTTEEMIDEMENETELGWEMREDFDIKDHEIYALTWNRKFFDIEYYSHEKWWNPEYNNCYEC